MTRATASDTDARQRADKWLWAARLFKTRALAAQAISGGKVHVNGARIKPARVLAVGDRLTVQQGPLTVELIIEGLSPRRGPAAEARLLYTETPASIAAREIYQEQHRLHAAEAPHPQHRPDKKSRRDLMRLARRGG